MGQFGVIQEQGDLGLGFEPIKNPKEQKAVEEEIKKESENTTAEK